MGMHNMSPGGRAILSARMKALHADPEFKARNSARMKALHSDPEFKARQSVAASARMKALNADPEFKARRVKTCVYCGRPGYRMIADGDGIFACLDIEGCEERIEAAS